MPGSYSTFSRRSYVNKSAAVLSAKFGDPTLIAINGFLSPNFLSGACTKIPWDINELGRDLYSRLRPLLYQIGTDPARTGIIGYSGGASLAMAILASDSEAMAASQVYRIGLGGIISSPILHPRTVFENLDAARREVRKNRDAALTTLDPQNLLFLALNGELTWQKIPRVFAKKPADFRRRYFNELVIVDLHDMIKALGYRVPANEDLSYYQTFLVDGYAHDKGLNPNKAKDAFDQDTDIRKTIARIRQPLLIHSAKDDPNHSNYRGPEQPQAVQEVVDFAKGRANVIMLNPTFGGHVSLILEPNFAELAEQFFGPYTGPHPSHSSAD